MNRRDSCQPPAGRGLGRSIAIVEVPDTRRRAIRT